MCLPDPEQQPTMPVEHAAEVLGIGRSAAYAAAREWLRTGGASGIPAVRVGRRILVPTAGLRRWLMMDEATDETAPVISIVSGGRRG
jgi:hypothetical protein